MNDTKNNVAIYNDYLKSINDVKRKVRNAQNVKRKALKKHINASEEDVKLIEDKALTNKTIVTIASLFKRKVNINANSQ